MSKYDIVKDLLEGVGEEALGNIRSQVAKGLKGDQLRNKVYSYMRNKRTGIPSATKMQQFLKK
jgi:hypothetical protein